MRARLKGEGERLVALAHQTEVFARQKVLKPLAKYLEPPDTPDAAGRKVLAMMKRIKARQES